MKYRQLHSTGSDETAPFEVYGYMAKTVEDFIQEVLDGNPDNWGEIEVKTINFVEGRIVEYADGKLKGEIARSLLHREISEVRSVGGWSRMDYRIFIK